MMGDRNYLCSVRSQKSVEITGEIMVYQVLHTYITDGMLKLIIDTVDSRYLEIEGTLKTLRDIRTSTYQICSIDGKTI